MHCDAQGEKLKTWPVPAGFVSLKELRMLMFNLIIYLYEPIYFVFHASVIRTAYCVRNKWNQSVFIAITLYDKWETHGQIIYIFFLMSELSPRNSKMIGLTFV